MTSSMRVMRVRGMGEFNMRHVQRGIDAATHNSTCCMPFDAARVFALKLHEASQPGVVIVRVHVVRPGQGDLSSFFFFVFFYTVSVKEGSGALLCSSKFRLPEDTIWLRRPVALMPDQLKLF